MMSDVVRTKKVAHEARPCVLMIFLPGEETHGNMHGTSWWNLFVLYKSRKEKQQTYLRCTWLFENLYQ